MQERLGNFASSCDVVGDVRGRGAMFGVEIVSDREAKTPGNELAEKIFYRCLDLGLSFKISQGCVLTLSPPLTIAQPDLDRAFGIVEQAISECAADQ